jgi:hypothetical protein
MPANNFSDPNLQIVTINDFSHGIVNGVESGTVYSIGAPLGSASYAVRCYSRPDVGLRPFPTYTIVYNRSFTGSATGNLVTLNALKSIGARSNQFQVPVESVVGSWTWMTATPPGTTNYIIDRFEVGGGTVANVYNAGIVGAVATQPAWGNFTVNLFQDPTNFTYNRCAVTAEGDGLWVTIPSYTPSVAVADHLTGTAPGNGTFPGYAFAEPVTSATNRTVFISSVNSFVTTDNFELVGPAVLFSTDINAMTNIGNAVFGPGEGGCLIGSWGSISTGETVFINQGSGGFLVYGDIAQPSTIVKLPGLNGTGGCVGEGIESPLGLIYVTEFDGAYLWNGGNASQKLSSQINDTVFQRNYLQTGGWPFTSGSTSNFPFNAINNVHNDCWSNWAMFANNYMFDCLNNSWWQVEDPNILIFDVHCQSSVTTRYFYSSTVGKLISGAGTIIHSIYRWDRNAPALSYTWISNPIPVTTGTLSSLQAVEILASNPYSTPATIVVTGTTPAGTTPFPNQIPNQTATFTVPPNTTNYRAQQAFGYDDYNIMVRVDASNTANGAPTIHEITLGIAPVRTSNV